MSRSAHHDHPDSEYAARVFKHLRHLAIELKQLGIHVVLVFVDDKCSAKCGEPGDAVAATERNKRVITNAAMAAIASMHDFAKFKINPSVLLLADIPDDINLSFYRGQVYVLVKDAVFQPSTPLRHSTEMRKALQHAGLHRQTEVLLVYSDGGPDHNVKFVTVWLAHILLFLACDLDFLIAARTCPQQSWRNCVEKIMSILNLAMYGVAFSW